MITVKHRGSFKNLEKFLESATRAEIRAKLIETGERGVKALQDATPKLTGLTAASWYYEIVHGRDVTKIIWCNSNVQDGANIAVLLQYGHATGYGAYVEGNDYINPALKDLFKKMADEIWEEVNP